MPPMMSRKQMRLARDLVLTGVPGKIASIVAAAVHDPKNLDPQLGTPAGSARELSSRIAQWMATQGSTDEPTREDIAELLDRVYGESRPDHFALLGV